MFCREYPFRLFTVVDTETTPPIVSTSTATIRMITWPYMLGIEMKYKVKDGRLRSQL